MPVQPSLRRPLSSFSPAPTRGERLRCFRHRWSAASQIETELCAMEKSCKRISKCRGTKVEVPFVLLLAAPLLFLPYLLELVLITSPILYILSVLLCFCFVSKVSPQALVASTTFLHFRQTKESKEERSGHRFLPPLSQSDKA